MRPEEPQADLFGERSESGAVPLPPDPGGEHDRHYVAEESLVAYRKNLLAMEGRRREVLDFLEGRGWRGATDAEGWRAMDLPTPNSYAPRRTELKEEGMIVFRGDTRETPAGNEAKVWVTARAWIEHHRHEGSS